MSVNDADALTCLQFRDDLNERCFARNSFIQWISNEEFLLVFNTYFNVYRLTPFYKSATVTDKFPVSVLRFEIDCQGSPSILQHCLNLLKVSEIDPNCARAGIDVTMWREINEVMSDPVYLQPSLACIPGGPIDPESLISISSVIVETDEKTDRHLFITSLVDGRMYATLKVSRRQTEMLSVTAILYDFLSENPPIMKAIIPDLPDRSQSLEEATSLSSLKRIRQLGKFLSTRYWFTTNLRFTGDRRSAVEADSFGISLQRSGHLIFWRYNANSDWRNFRVVNLEDQLIGKLVSSGIVCPIDEAKCVLILGTLEGEVIRFTITLGAVINGFDDTALGTLIGDDCVLAVSALRLFPLDNAEYLLLIARQFVLTAAVVSVSNGALTVKASQTVRTQCRFAITDIIRFEDAFYVSSFDKVAKYGISMENGVALKLQADSIIPLDKAKVVGLAFSKNNVLLLDAVMRKYLDKYGKSKPLTVRVTKVIDPNQLWTILTSKENLKDAADYLILLRAFILHHEHSKIIGDLLIQELEALEAHDDPNVLLKLKIFRFATTVFSGRRSKADDLEFWNRVREKVERILAVKVAKTMLERARALDWSKPMPAIRQATTSVIDFLASEGVDITDCGPFGNLTRALCPLCAADSFQSSTVAEHICSNGHRYPSCTLSLLPIPSYSYRKCGRCDLAVLDRESMSDLEELIPERDYCQFCDGRIVEL